ncbi:universal stress protein [Gaetbulibacter aestuarii]|uniref:Universal stress protein n=1 Tax=Gaetbulibacter aestuarii TaxID=1502358 RepID=A0ABW7MWY0_9FLAO
MKRHILLPTDFSDNAWNAIVYALKLFKDEYCTFYFLHSVTIKVSMLSNLSNRLIKTMEQDAMKELLALRELAETSDANANHDFQIILTTDELYRAIKKAILEWNIEMVVMGTKGASGAKRFFLGSNTVNISKTLNDCSLLIIPEEYDFIEPKQIALPTDYNRFYDPKELRQVKVIADLFNSKLRIIHINEEDDLNNIQKYNLSSLQNYLDTYEYSIHWMPKYAKKAKEIHDFVDELEIDLLAMVRYKHSWVEKIMNEPVIQNIGFHPKIPFLVIPE